MKKMVNELDKVENKMLLDLAERLAMRKNCKIYPEEMELLKKYKLHVEDRYCDKGAYLEYGYKDVRIVRYRNKINYVDRIRKYEERKAREFKYPTLYMPKGATFRDEWDKDGTYQDEYNKQISLQLSERYRKFVEINKDIRMLDREINGYLERIEDRVLEKAELKRKKEELLKG